MFAFGPFFTSWMVRPDSWVFANSRGVWMKTNGRYGYYANKLELQTCMWVCFQRFVCQFHIVLLFSPVPASQFWFCVQIALWKLVKWLVGCISVILCDSDVMCHVNWATFSHSLDTTSCLIMRNILSLTLEFHSENERKIQCQCENIVFYHFHSPIGWELLRLVVILPYIFRCCIQNWEDVCLSVAV